MYDEKEVSIITVMNQVMHMEMKSASQLLKQYDLKTWQAGILFALHHNSGLSQRELAKKMRLTPPTITAGIQKMEKRGLIVRRSDAQDQRIMRLYLTDKAEECIEQIQEVIRQMEEMLIQGFTLEEKILLRRFLLQILENLNREMEKESL